MPRKLKDVDPEDVINEADKPNPVVLPTDALYPGDKQAKGKDKFLPYISRKELPPAYVKLGEKLNADGIKQTVILSTRPGEPRYMCNPTLGGVELIKIYSKHNGVGKALVRTLRDKRPDDLRFRMRLRKMGIPGA